MVKGTAGEGSEWSKEHDRESLYHLRSVLQVEIKSFQTETQKCKEDWREMEGINVSKHKQIWLTKHNIISNVV